MGNERIKMKLIKSFGPTSDSVQYNPYDANLPSAFAEIKSIIHAALPDADIEHVGSSSIPGVGGRNVIDVSVIAGDADQIEIKRHLYDLGFQDSPFPHYLPLLVGTLAFQEKNYPILLYVVEPDAHVLKSWIAFRDYMRLHPEDAQAYDQIKRNNIAAGMVGGERYQEAKTPFIVSMIQKIHQGHNS
jgi:GrpB-like predicted nucleotidyltransferase (UPF0157 family)